jgi:hypothetical protein
MIGTVSFGNDPIFDFCAYKTLGTTAVNVVSIQDFKSSTSYTSGRSCKARLEK